MRRILFAAIIAVIFFLSNSNFLMAYEKEIRNISSTLTENIAKAGKKMIAVVDFTDLQGNVTELGRFLAEEFSVAFAGVSKGFEVVDRTHLKTILAEHKLSTTGIIDPQTARRLGQIVGVDALITGTITPFGDSVRLSVKILDTTTARVIGASSGDIAKTKAIEELLARGIEVSQPLRQEPSIPSVPPTISPKSRKIGDIIVTMKNIIVSRNQVMVTLDFFNQSDKLFKLGKSVPPEPGLRDEMGNIYKYTAGIEGGRSHSFISDYESWITLNPKSNNDIVLYFTPSQRNVDTREIGSNFSFSLSYALYNPKDRSTSSYNVLFTDIKAQLPK